MKKVNFNNLRDKYIEYVRSQCYDIHEAYRLPSKAKVDAWKGCEELCYNNSNWVTELKIVGKNMHIFSAGFTAEIDGEYCFVYITPKNSKYAVIDESITHQHKLDMLQLFRGVIL